MGQSVQRSTTNKGLSGLRLRLARSQVVTENRFETKHARFLVRGLMAGSVKGKAK
jgi:hypothetical protein